MSMTFNVPLFTPLCRSMRNWMSDFRYGFEGYIANDKKNKRDMSIDIALVDALCPVTFKPTRDGLYLEQDGTFIQCLTIGDPSPVNPDRQPIPEGAATKLIEDILSIPIHDDTCIALTHTCIRLPAKDENGSIETARRENMVDSVVQEQKSHGLVKTHNKINDYIQTDIDRHQYKVYKGEISTFEFSLIVAVQGTTKEAVNATMNLIITMLDGKRVINEIPVNGMMDVFQTMMPTPYIAQRLLSEVEGDKVVATCPLWNPNSNTFANFGRFMGTDTSTNVPIFLNFHDNSLVSGHGLVIGKSGAGKSSILLVDDIRAVADGDLALHIVPKTDGKTDHIAVCKAMKGRLIKIGQLGNNFNMMQIFYDKTKMRGDIEAYQKAYGDHVAALVDSIGLLVGSGFSDPQKNQLYNSLVALYKEEREYKGEKFAFIDYDGNVIEKNLKYWDVAECFPDFDDLRNIWYSWINDGKHRLEKHALSALYANTSMISKGQILGYLVNKNPLDLDNPFVMIDISELIDTPNVQDALILLITRIINIKISGLRSEYTGKKIFITLDEGSNLMKNAKLRLVIEKLFRELRSYGGHVKIVFQDLAGIEEDTLQMLKTNTDYTILLSNMNSGNIRPLVKEFDLTPNDIRQLKKVGHGLGLFIMNESHINYYNALTPDEEAKLFGSAIPKEPVTDTIKKQELPWKVSPEYEWMAGKPGVLDKRWFIRLNGKTIPGWEAATTFHPFTGKRTAILVKAGMIKENGHIYQQTQDHYFTVTLAGGDLAALPQCTEVTFDNWGSDKSQEADVKIKFSIIQSDNTVVERVLGLEYEVEGSHTKEQLIAKRERLLNKKVNGQHVYTDIIFFSNNEYYPFLLEAVGADFACQRGSQLKKRIDDILAEMETCNPVCSNNPLDEQSPENAAAAPVL